MVLVDDRLGRSWAERHQLENHGLLWILRELRQIEAITNLRPALNVLRQINYYLPEEEIGNLLAEFGES